MSSSLYCSEPGGNNTALLRVFIYNSRKYWKFPGILLMFQGSWKIFIISNVTKTKTALVSSFEGPDGILGMEFDQKLTANGNMGILHV